MMLLAKVGLDPTTKHADDEGHAIPVGGSDPVGRARMDHDRPESVVAKNEPVPSDAFSPTEKQLVTDGHLMLSRPRMPVATNCVVHSFPASVVARIIPFCPAGSEPSA